MCFFSSRRRQTRCALVTGVQTCALPISTADAARALARYQTRPAPDEGQAIRRLPVAALELEAEATTALVRAGLKTIGDLASRSAERRVVKVCVSTCRSRWETYL